MPRKVISSTQLYVADLMEKTGIGESLCDKLPDNEEINRSNIVYETETKMSKENSKRRKRSFPKGGIRSSNPHVLKNGRALGIQELSA